MPLYALVDCNNFYASCERLFRPIEDPHENLLDSVLERAVA